MSRKKPFLNRKWYFYQSVFLVLGLMKYLLAKIAIVIPALPFRQSSLLWQRPNAQTYYNLLSWFDNKVIRVLPPYRRSSTVSLTCVERKLLFSKQSRFFSFLQVFVVRDPQLATAVFSLSFIAAGDTIAAPEFDPSAHGARWLQIMTKTSCLVTVEDENVSE